MKHIIVKDGKIENVIEADEAVAKELKALPYYEGAGVGGDYNPPKEPTTQDRVQALEAQLKASIQSNALLEECLIEMAGIVYA